MFLVDLTDADLAGADLAGANLSDAFLSGVVLSGADLSDANLWRAEVGNADLVTIYYRGRPRWPDGFELPLPVEFRLKVAPLPHRSSCAPS